MLGQLLDGPSVLRYTLGGNATLTLVSKRTKRRITYRVKKPNGTTDRYWVEVMTGSDNERSFSIVGGIWALKNFPGEHKYWHLKRSPINDLDARNQAFMYFFKYLHTDPARLFNTIEVWHDGQCARCGRKLTVPSSVESGFGPECASALNMVHRPDPAPMPVRPTFYEQQPYKQLPLFKGSSHDEV